MPSKGTSYKLNRTHGFWELRKNYWYQLILYLEYLLSDVYWLQERIRRAGILRVVVR
jgi:hypothetical protein